MNQPSLFEAADAVNRLSRFLGPRDVPRLTGEALMARFQIPQADVMALFGGSILEGAAVMAQAMEAGAAKTYVIVGGEGHTTKALREAAARRIPGLNTAGLPEARIFNALLKHDYGLEADLLECESTNCGNNITLLLSLLERRKISFESIILTQDASMQLRMAAGLRRHRPDAHIISYAAYEARAAVRRGQLAFQEDIPGMWPMDRYLSLLLGEIPRLTDDENGYGPRGKGFIAHVDIPPEISDAFALLSGPFGGQIRRADPRFQG